MVDEAERVQVPRTVLISSMPASSFPFSKLVSTDILIGGTLLGLSADHSLPARAVIRIGNWQGGFDCLDDTADGLRSILEESFEQAEIEVGPSTADFIARGPH